MSSEKSSKGSINYLVKGEVRSLPEIDLTKATCERFSITTDGEAYRYNYRNQDGKLVAAKVRNIAEKAFAIEGDWKDAEPLYGMNLFPKNGKFVTLLEGEKDAASAFQMTGSKFACVSVKNGAAGAAADCRKAYDWLNSFETIVICFDNDDPGKKAANEVAEIFGAKAKIFKHASNRKDANEYLMQQEEKEFTDRWWRAEQYTPDGIVNGAGLWELVNSPVEPAACLYPWEGLNKITYGIRFGELVTVSAGSGLGKSQFLREVLYHLVHKTEDNIGCLFLEEGVKKTAKSIMSLHANKPLHLPDTEATEEELRDAFDATLGTGRLFLFDHFGSTSVDNIINRVRYMARGLGCKYVFLDHVSIVVSAQESGDERKALDEIMTKLRMMVQETGIALFVVSHLKRPEGRGHEEGAATSLAQLRGSGSIAQLSDIVIGLERNGQAEDVTERNTTKVRVLKNRFSGITGPACGLLYNATTGRMFEHSEDDL